MPRPAVARSPRWSSPSCSWRVRSPRPSAGPTAATWATPTGPTTGSSARRSRSSATRRRPGSTSNAALLATDDPDKLFWATNEHVFNEKGHGRGAVDRISEFFHEALVAHQAGDDLTASIRFGWMAHYYGDILQPYHTNYAAVDLDDSHRRYEMLVQAVTRNPDASPEWSTANRTPEAVADVRTTAIAAAAYSRKFFPELYRLFKVDETVLTPRVGQITGFLLKRASSDLADILYSLDQGVGDAAPAASVKATIKYRYAAKNTTQTVYVTVKGEHGQPLEGIRVDIAFPKGTGGRPSCAATPPGRARSRPMARSEPVHTASDETSW